MVSAVRTAIPIFASDIHAPYATDEGEFGRKRLETAI
jgi:hypothetical protein